MTKKLKTINFKVDFMQRRWEIGAGISKQVGVDNYGRPVNQTTMPQKTIKFTHGIGVFKEDHDYVNPITDEMITAEEYVLQLYKQNKKLFNTGEIRIIRNPDSEGCIKLLIEKGFPGHLALGAEAKVESTPVASNVTTGVTVSGGLKGNVDAGRKAVKAAKEAKKDK